MGLAFGKRELLESWRPYKVRPAANEPVGHRFELGTSQHELLAGFVAAVDYVDVARLGRDRSVTSARSASASSPACPANVELYGHPARWTDACRRSASTCTAIRRRRSRRSLAERDVAVWHGDYYAVETMKYLGLSDGAVRAGIVHYNTEDEVDRLLEGLAALA